MTEPVVPGDLRELLEKALPAVRVCIAACGLGHVEGKVEYWEALEAKIEASLARPALPAPEPPLLKRLQTARIALGGATATRRETGAHVREMDADVWDKWCDELRAIEMALRAAAPAPPDPKESQ